MPTVLIFFSGKHVSIFCSFWRAILNEKIYLKVTYHENSTFRCYNRVSGACTDPENVKKINPIIFFVKPFSASLWKKNEPLRFLCARASDVRAQKTIYQKFKLIWINTHDFSSIDIIIKTMQMFLAEYLRYDL